MFRKNKNFGAGIPVTVGVPQSTVQQGQVASGTPNVSSSQVQAAQAQTGTFIAITTYIENVGDEPPTPGIGVIDLTQCIDASTYQQLCVAFSSMPRAMFTPWFQQEVAPSLPAPPTYGQINPTTYNVFNGGNNPIPVSEWTSLIQYSLLSLFNEQNVAACNDRELDPWAWEQLKMESYYNNTTVSDESTMLQTIAANIDPQALALAQAYQQLDPLGDLGLEIRRQNAFNLLLAQKDYTDAQNILDQFNNADNATKAVMFVPIPLSLSVTKSDGTTETLNPTAAGTSPNGP